MNAPETSSARTARPSLARVGAVQCVLFDFFGTLVGYNPSRKEQGYDRSHAVFRRLGGTLEYDPFLHVWDELFCDFERRCDGDDREFSMWDVTTAFFAAATTAGTVPPLDVDEFVAVYLDEWSTGVSDIDGLAAMLEDLGRTYRLAVVTNTHAPDLVPGHLRRMGLDGAFDAVITSVEVGRRKPHPAIYAAALERLGVEPAGCVFVGDTLAPDYLGPRAAGMAARLIDPAGHHADAVPAADRLMSVLDLASTLP